MGCHMRFPDLVEAPEPPSDASSSKGNAPSATAAKAEGWPSGRGLRACSALHRHASDSARELGAAHAGGRLVREGRGLDPAPRPPHGRISLHIAEQLEAIQFSHDTISKL